MYVANEINIHLSWTSFINFYQIERTPLLLYEVAKKYHHDRAVKHQVFAIANFVGT